MAGEALPWLLGRTLNILNEHDKLQQDFQRLSHYASVSLLKLHNPASRSSRHFDPDPIVTKLMIERILSASVGRSTTTSNLSGPSSSSSSLGSLCLILLRGPSPYEQV
jgi:hypothetical protein